VSLFKSLHLLYSALTGLWRYFLMTDKLTTMRKIADQIYSLAQEQNNSELMRSLPSVGIYYHMGDFDSARPYATVC
jgi:hypothetical protein